APVTASRVVPCSGLLRATLALTTLDCCASLTTPAMDPEICCPQRKLTENNRVTTTRVGVRMYPTPLRLGSSKALTLKPSKNSCEEYMRDRSRFQEDFVRRHNKVSESTFVKRR